MKEINEFQKSAFLEIGKYEGVQQIVMRNNVLYNILFC